MLSDYLPFHTRIPCLFLYLRLLLHPHETSSSRGARHEWCGLPCATDLPDQPQSLPPEIDLSLMKNPSTPLEHPVEAVRSLKPFLPGGCEVLGQGDLKITGSFPIDAGGFADMWVGKMKDGTTVAIKSHRSYSSTSCLPVYVRLYKEASMCSRLSDDGKIFVPFIAIYSTPEHPFGLVFKFVDHLNLRDYLWNNQNVSRLELLLEIARGLEYLHGLGIVHGNVGITNFLVGGDGHVRIAGLGTAFIPPTAPGDMMASDVYGFSFLAWEVFAGRAPFSDRHIFTRVHSILKGRRPTRPDHPELSNRVWKTIKGCWRADPSKRTKISQVVAVLEGEVNAHKAG